MSPAERRLRQTLAANVQRLRASHGLTQEAAADRAKMHWRHVQKIEGGEVNVTLKTLARLAEAFGVAASSLLG